LTSATSAATSYDEFDDRYLGAKSSPPSVDNDGNALLTGALYWNTVSNKMFVWSGSAWTEISSTADIISYKYTATSGATSVSGADDNGLTLSYTVGKEQVYINGVLQVRGSDYTASTGTSITGMAALTASDIVTILAFTAFVVANTYTIAQADATFIPDAIVDAKGDIVTATANDTPARLAVGNNGETLVVDSTTSTGLRYQGNFAAGKNKIINGDFGIWQRGTSTNSASAASTFLADRWVGRFDYSSGTASLSQQTFTPGTAPVAGYEGSYFLRLTMPSGASSYGALAQKIEDVRTLAGQTVTVSFWAKSSLAQSATILLRQDFGTGGSAIVDLTTAYSLTTAWQRFTWTVTLGSLSGKTIGTGSNLLLQPFIYGIYTSSSTLDIWGVQVEAGNVATAFQTATGTIQGELSACQRYYFKHPATGANSPINTGSYYSSSNVGTIVPFPVTMRVAPTFSVATGSDYYQAVRNGGLDGFNSFTQDSSNTLASILYNNTEASGTAGHAALIIANNASASIAWSAEL
jgi:hypothetical protein